jgi:hypothetical protein
MQAINIDKFHFRKCILSAKINHGGSRIYVKKVKMTKELNYVQELGDENI